MSVGWSQLKVPSTTAIIVVSNTHKPQPSSSLPTSGNGVSPNAATTISLCRHNLAERISGESLARLKEENPIPTRPGGRGTCRWPRMYARTVEKMDNTVTCVTCPRLAVALECIPLLTGRSRPVASPCGLSIRMNGLGTCGLISAATINHSSVGESCTTCTQSTLPTCAVPIFASIINRMRPCTFLGIKHVAFAEQLTCGATVPVSAPSNNGTPVRQPLALTNVKA